MIPDYMRNKNPGQVQFLRQLLSVPMEIHSITLSFDLTKFSEMKIQKTKFEKLNGQNKGPNHMNHFIMKFSYRPKNEPYHVDRILDHMKWTENGPYHKNQIVDRIIRGEYRTISYGPNK